MLPMNCGHLGTGELWHIMRSSSLLTLVWQISGVVVLPWGGRCHNPTHTHTARHPILHTVLSSGCGWSPQVWSQSTACRGSLGMLQQLLCITQATTYCFWGRAKICSHSGARAGGRAVPLPKGARSFAQQGFGQHALHPTPPCPSHPFRILI